MFNRFKSPPKPCISFLIGSLLAMATSASAKLPTVIALFGDSITVGYNADFAPNLKFGNGSTTNGRPTIELNALMKGPPMRNVIVANYGIGGSNTGTGGPNNGLSRINNVLDDNTEDFPGSDYYILIMYGSNDLNAGISADTTGFNVEEITKRSQERGYTAIVGTVTPRSDQSVTSRNAKIIAAASNRNAPLVDHYSVFVNYPGGYKNQLIDIETGSSGDLRYLHPNELGYKVIAEEWFNEELEDRISPIPIMAPILLLLDD